MSVYDLVDAEKVFVNNTDAVVRAMIARAKAAAAVDLMRDITKEKYRQDNTVAGGGYYVEHKAGDKVSLYDWLKLNG